MAIKALDEGVIEFVKQIVDSADENRAMAVLVDDDGLYNAEQYIFWVDWRGDDDDIAQDCEAIIQSGKLSSEFAEEADELLITYGSTMISVPLASTTGDRHRVLCGLNQAFAGDFEARLCVASGSSDCVALLPLRCSAWSQLESMFGAERLEECFEPLSVDDNFFEEL